MNNFLRKFVVRGEGQDKELIIKRCQKVFQSLIVMVATIIRDPFVMCNVNKV